MHTEMHKTDQGTPELRKRHVVTFEETSDVRKRARVMSEVPIDFYLHNGKISVRQWDAANLLYGFWYYGAVRSSYVVSRDPRTPRVEPNVESRGQCQQKYRKAMNAISGKQTQLLIYDVVCLGEFLININHIGVEKNRRLERLKDGLDDLARHFKIPMTKIKQTDVEKKHNARKKK